MKYAPKKVFILENDNYVEITYEELCRREMTEQGYDRNIPRYGCTARK